MPLDFRSKIDQIEAETGFSKNRLNLDAGLANGTLQAAYKDNRELSSDKLDKFLDHWNVNREWWETGKGDVLEKKPTSVEKNSFNDKKMDAARETFYRDLIENNEEYSLLPKAVFKDYKIMPQDMLKLITESKDNERKTLIDKYELIITGLENEVRSLRVENDNLRRQVATKAQ